MSLVTIKKSSVELSVQLLKSRLESEGIKCYLKNEIAAQIMSHMSAFVVEIQVSSSDVERAKKIMNAS